MFFGSEIRTNGETGQGMWALNPNNFCQTMLRATQAHPCQW